ncbi:MAG: PQQ-binding-like beta-propeller repeat protein [Verrucomicrobia bacterium]|nr:PQQ-binding-like beta-propeller repeat protein [Verrucomicrobiota bacterium]
MMYADKLLNPPFLRMNLILLIFLTGSKVFLLSSVQAVDPVSGENWPQFRGPHARGVAESGNIPAQWSATNNVEWKVDIPGRGWSSPIVWGDRVFLTTVINHGETEQLKKGLYFGGDRHEVSKTEHEWKVLCLSLTSGKLLWERSVHKGVPPTPIHIKNSYASETPVTDGEYVYACFGNVGIFCLDFKGKEIWSYPLKVNPTRLDYGPSASPVINGDRIYYVSDNDRKSYLLALNKRTGRQIFRVLRNEKTNWSTPYIWKNTKRTEIVTAGTAAIRSYSLEGKELWEITNMSSHTIATPYEAEGLLYVSSGYIGDKVKPFYAIKPGGRGDITLSRGQTNSDFVAWSNFKIAPYNPSTLVHGGFLYVLLDRAIFSCFDAKTGVVHYNGQRLPRSVGITASPWASGNHIYCLNEDGVCYVLRAGKDFQIMHRNVLGRDDLCMSSPALAGDRLLIRTDKRLYSIRNK